MGSAPWERMLIFCYETGQKTAALGWALEGEAAIVILLNLHDMPANLPSNYLYLFMVVLSTSKNFFFLH